ncbi:MAG: DUF6515 family protein [Desulfomonilia bacterium]
MKHSPWRQGKARETMKNSTRIGLTLVLVLACIISFALPVEAREPHQQKQGVGLYQADHAKKHGAVQKPRHQKQGIGSYHADRGKKHAAHREILHQKRHHTRPHSAPPRHVPVVVNTQRYLYLDGSCYRQCLSGYIAVQGPFGAVVLTLPIGH